MTVLTRPKDETLEADGVRLRYRDIGQGDIVVSLGGYGNAEVPRAHALIAKQNRLIALDVPAGCQAATVNKALATLGIERFSVLANGAAAELALWMALDQPARIGALVLIAPIAIRRAVVALETDLESRMTTLPMPVLALFGTRDKVVPTDMARLYSGLLPKCFATMIYNATHAVDSDRPEAVAAIVNEFLKHGESFIVNRDSGLLHP
jgi:pimeloyl-ACP methyl ester carboxylesterase